MGEPETEILAPDGRRLGRRAQETRRRLLDATAALLESHGVLELKVVEIARQVGTSPATFYQYFRDVDEAVLALAEEAGEEIETVARWVRGEWRGAAGLVTARALIDGFMQYWDVHRAVLRTRNLAAQEGDERFREVRVRTLSAITDPLADRVAQSQRDGLVVPAITPYAAAAAMVAMMERMAAFHYEFEARGVARPAMVETLTVIIHQVVTGGATD
ncbi:MAG: transcriptional regulator, TetR family [Acidimicrobiales bacterium]|jgi:AcrR family transcriptional regulator|nr:transcriptional regulator, TetR family [Acidimicrobiales bacterium]